MKTIFYPFAALLLVSAVIVLYKTTAAADHGVSSVTVSHHPELEYLKAVNSVAPPQDPQLLFSLIARNPRMRLEALIRIFHNANHQAWLIAVPDQQNLPSYGLHQASGSRNKTSSCPRGPCDSMSCVITVRPPTRAANKTRDALHGQTSERDVHEDDRENRLQQQQPLRPWQTLKPFQASHTATSDSLSPRRNARGVKLKSTNRLYKVLIYQSLLYGPTEI